MHINVCPSTDCQWDLLRLLEKELKELGITDIELNEYLDVALDKVLEDLTA